MSTKEAFDVALMGLIESSPFLSVRWESEKVIRAYVAALTAEIAELRSERDEARALRDEVMEARTAKGRELAMLKAQNMINAKETAEEKA